MKKARKEAQQDGRKITSVEIVCNGAKLSISAMLARLDLRRAESELAQAIAQGANNATVFDLANEIESLKH